MARARARSPSTASWDETILRFQFFRRMEKRDALHRAKRLPLLLSAVAQEIYDAANELERTGTLTVNLGDFGMRKIADHIAFHGHAFEVQHRFVPLEFLDDLPTHLVATAPALRRWAHKLKDNADRGQRLISLYEESVEMLRGSTKGGRFPSVSMYWLIRKTDEWHATIPEIARQLLQRGVVPTSASDDPDPQHQWEMLLKKGRLRARRRIAAKGSCTGDRARNRSLTWVPRVTTSQVGHSRDGSSYPEAIGCRLAQRSRGEA